MDPRIVKSVAGDQGALSELLVEQHDRIVARLKRNVPKDLRATFDLEDVLQETFADAFRGIGTFEPRSDRAFVNWLTAIAKHRLQDAIRGVRRKKRGGGLGRVDEEVVSKTGSMMGLLQQVAADQSTPSSKVARREALAVMQVHLASLPEKYRQVIELRHLQELSREQIAERIGLTEDAVRGLLERAMTKLRDAMGNSSLYFGKK